MRHSPRLGLLQTVILVIVLAACNFPSAAPATPTALPPTATLPPPTETATSTPLPPTETPTPLPPTATLALSTAPILPSPTLAPTRAAIEPVAGAKFEGSFEGGEIVFRTHQNGKMVIPKSVRIRKARCQEGKTISDLIAFDPPPTFPIVDGKFTITKDSYMTMYGEFTTPNQARGTISMTLKGEGKNCTIGPVGWIAYAP